MNHDDSALLRLILLELTALRRQVDALSKPSPSTDLTPNDRAKLRLLQPFMSDRFTVGSLIKRIIEQEDTTLAKTLGNAKQIGRLLARAERAGYVARSGTHPTVWHRLKR